MYVVLTLLSLLPLLVAGQVLRIYLAEGEALRALGKRQADSFVTIPAMRGAILDRAGRTLAVNTARYDLALDPTVPGFDRAADLFFEQLSRLTGRPEAALRRQVRRRTSPQYVLLARGLSETQKEEVETWEVPGLILHPRFGRRYTYGETAAHVLGYVDPDLRGLAGLELQYDDQLRGTPGRRAVRRDRRGVLKAVPDGVLVEPQHGQTLVLTIDLVRQTILEEELARAVAEHGARWGTAIAMDPHTGAILAMANVPSFNPNRRAAAPAEAERNRAITDRMEPGSTFKLVTAVAAVEQGVVALEDSIETGDGWMVIHGRTLKDTHAFGTLTFAGVIAHSSNVGMAKVAMRLDPGVFYQYARNLGFGQNTWIDLPGEVPGLLKKPAAWSGTTLTSMSRGYEVDATPLQVLAAYSALANGGLLVRPYVVAERRDVTGRTVWVARQDSVRRAFRQATARKLLPAFEAVVEYGTGEKARLAGLRVAGKTGTALKARDGGYERGAYRASFVGFFPAEDPAVAMIVVLDEPKTSIYGGSVAAPVFQRIARRWLGTFPKLAALAQPAPSADPEERPERPVPDVTGRPAAVAAGLLQAHGYRVDRPETAGATVARQRPAPGEPAPLHARVRLDLAAPDTALVMPDLTGLSARAATFWLTARGVEVRLEGNGLVAGQVPCPGAPLPKRAVLHCRPARR
ncbi:MAG: penicillin-binding protein 3 [Rhodothermaceae bacterium]|nr:MAG: penicillin-binding protein 3 [Rhodothermaceae bacterium]